MTGKFTRKYTRQDVTEMLTHRFLSDRLSLDEATGVLRWKERPVEDFANEGQWKRFNTERVGRRAGGYIEKATGYNSVGFHSINFRYHRVVYAMAHGISIGEVPPILDHINGNTKDNRPANLRAASELENLWNSKVREISSTGLKGVTYHPHSGLWRARIKAFGKHINLGLFHDEYQAAAAYAGAAKILHGEYYRPTGIEAAA